jgi:hypothetical protein
MANRWNIPPSLEQQVLARDKNCVYCGGPATTWEHIVNDARIVTRENIARCCGSCNSSKSVKDLAVWLQSEYCKAKGITKETVAGVVRRALARRRKSRTI